MTVLIEDEDAVLSFSSLVHVEDVLARESVQGADGRSPQVPDYVSVYHCRL